MPKKPQHSANRSNQMTISYATIGVIGSILAMIIGLTTIGSKIATKADVESIKSAFTPTLTDHETRLRSLEYQTARFFGSSQTSVHPTPSSTEGEAIEKAHLVMAQYYPQASQSAPAIAAPKIPQSQRRIVVPITMITLYNLQPTTGGSYAVLGEDGRYYALDDILAIIIQMHFSERRGLK